MTDRERAKIMYDCHLWMAGDGHFDLSINDVATIFRLLRLKKTKKDLHKALLNFYESHPMCRSIRKSFQEQYLQY